jgi:SGNH domain-containing protein
MAGNDGWRPVRGSGRRTGPASERAPGRTVRDVTRAGRVRRRLGAACLLGACLGLTVSGLSVLTGLTGLTGLTASGAAPVAREAASGGARVADRLPPGLSGSEHASLERAGAFGRRPVHLLILGDSIAMTLGMGLSVHARPEYGVSVIDDATVGCDLDPDLEVMTEGAPGPATQGCDNWRALWPFLTAREQPQVVALGLGRWEVTDHLLDGQWVHIGEPAWDSHLTSDLDAAISIFHGFGAKVVLFTMPYVDPSDRQPDGSPWSENTPSRTRAYNALVRAVAGAHPGEVQVIDLNRMLSRAGSYTATVDGIGVRTPDGIHVSTSGGELLQRRILPAIDRMGLEDETAAAKARV